MVSSPYARGVRYSGKHDCVFFFQAEDGIRDYKVTGVQTCALPILDEEPLHAGGDLVVKVVVVGLVVVGRQDDVEQARVDRLAQDRAELDRLGSRGVRRDRESVV